MRLLLFLLFFSIISAVNGQTLLLGQGSSWKYFDQGDVNDSNWNQPGFDDSGWGTGNAQLGYGEGDENTVVSYGNDANNKHITTYFRQEIFVVNPQQFSHLELNLLRDDGAVVYVNGTEVWRSNMPGGVIGFSTEADGTVAWPNEDDWHTINVSASHLVNGNNIVAVEIHQENGGSSDISFDFSMIAHSSLQATITRGPYLQKVNQHSIIVRWRTDVPTDSRVNYGVSPVQMNGTALNPHFTNDHEVHITGLSEETVYYYSVGHFGASLAGSPNMYFQTMPANGQPGDYSFLVLGDCGTGYQEQIDVKNAVVPEYGNHYDGVILLGDNAYQSGFDSDYQTNFFNNKYNEIFDNTVIWPAPGNHDYNNHIPFSPAPAYYDIFNCPESGECGGTPSGTEKYYSFEYGNIHFISLDSYDEPRSASAAMATWLASDLANNTQPWVIAYWHHPPYTKGSHDSDNGNFLDGELVEMREEILPILEGYGVDLILNGHSHSYERSMLIDGHYGYSNSFGPTHIADNSSGDYPTSCPYHKNTGSGESHKGTVYCVMGNSGKTSSVDADWPHPVMYSYTADEVGAIILEVNGNRLDATFHTGTDYVFDHYTIVKSEQQSYTVEACINEEVILDPSWPVDGLSLWNPGNVLSQSYSLQALNNGTVIRTDQSGCIPDTFNIIALQNDSCGYLNLPEVQASNSDFTAFWVNQDLHIHQEEFHFTGFELYDISGRRIADINVKDKIAQQRFTALNKGLYLVKPKNSSISKIIYREE